jgi:hypothetical protein
LRARQTPNSDSGNCCEQIGQFFPETTNSSFISTLPSNFQLWILSLEATHSRSPGLGVNRPGHQVGVELISAKKPYLYRDIAWDCLSFFTLMKWGSLKNLIWNRAAG